MFDIIASTYMTAARMDHFLEQDFMHRNPRTAQRLRYIHGLDTPNPSLTRKLRGRIGMDGPIELPNRPSRIVTFVKTIISVTGKTLRLAGEWLEQTTAPPNRLGDTCCS